MEVVLTDDSEHGSHAFVHGFNPDYRRVVDGDLLEGQHVDPLLVRHMDHFAWMKADIILVPHHRDLLVGKFKTELGCLTLLHGHILDGLDELQTDSCDVGGAAGSELLDTFR